MSGDRTRFADEATLKRLHALEAENKRLREALEVYGNPGNWLTMDDYYSYDQDRWAGDGSGFYVAQKALKGEE